MNSPVQLIGVLCEECGTKSNIKLPTNPVVSTVEEAAAEWRKIAAKAMKDARCPECGGRKLLL